MTEQTLRRNLDSAYDPGPDFPDRLLLSRTMALVRAEAASADRRNRLKRSERWPLSWLGPAIGLVPTLQLAAAVLLMVALAVASMGLFFLVHQLTVPAKPVGGPVILPTNMVSPTTGWAVVPPTKVWRTGDGGTHWRDVSPPSLPARATQSPAESKFFLDGNRAWIAEIGRSGTGGPGGYVAVFRTANGGRTWQQGESVLDPDLLVATNLYFIDALHGWLLMSMGNPADPGAPPTLYRTSDGGEHWKLTSSGAARSSTYCGQQMSFATVDSGWITSCDEEVPIVLVTRDGGATWQAQQLPLTTAHASCPCYFQNAPQFFDGLHGILVLYGSPGALYVTSDGGATWTAHALPGEEQMAVDFVDPGYGWAIAGSSSQLTKREPPTPPTLPSGPLPLYQTDDGGATWNLLQTDLMLESQDGRIGSLYFVDQKDGFALRVGSTGPTQFLKTTDGGRTWTVVVTLRTQH